MCSHCVDSTSCRLRTAYISYWAATRKLAIGESYLSGERDAKAAMVERTSDHLLLPSDELEAFSTWEVARRNQADFVRIGTRALANLQIASGLTLGTFTPRDPKIGDSCSSREGFVRAALDGSPLLAAARAQARVSAVRAQSPPSVVHGGIEIIQSAGSQWPATGPANGTSIGFDMSVPVGFAQADRAGREKLSAIAEQDRLATELLEARLRADADEVWLGYRQAQQNLVYAEMRLAAANAAVHEQEVRFGKVPSATIDVLERVRAARYQVALDEIDARSAVFDRQAALARLAPMSCSASTSVSQPDLGLVAWHADALLSASSDEAFWGNLSGRHVSRLLVSFAASQIAGMGPGGALRPRVEAFIDAAGRHGIEVDALLGDARWLLPAHRSELATIVARLRGLAFAGFELDLEPNQLPLPGLSVPDAVAAIADTAKAVVGASLVPVGVIVQPQYLVDRDAQCLTCQLLTAGVRKVTVMLHSTDPQATGKALLALENAHPDTNFSVAQSVEGSRPASESYAKAHRAEFSAAMLKLAASAAGPNFGGIVVQDYDGFLGLPE
jgi:Outer membrane efflux protein